jgi:hypothetical protein
MTREAEQLLTGETGRILDKIPVEGHIIAIHDGRG